MVQIEYLPIVLTGIGIIVSILYYTSVLRNANTTRQAQLFMQLFQEMNTERFWETWIDLLAADIPDYQTYLEKYDSTVNREHFAKRTQMWYHFNAIGDLVKKGTLSLETVEPIVGTAGFTLWIKWGEIIKQIRIDYGMPRTYDGFEYLYNSLEKYYELHPELKVLDTEVFTQADL